VPGSSLTIEQVLTLLAETPKRIASLTAGLSPAQLRPAAKRDESSANDVLAHLRASDMWGNCIVAMIAEERPAWRGVQVPDAPGPALVDRNTIRIHWDAVEQRVRDYLAKLRDDAL
jgi:hypothetical protein